MSRSKHYPNPTPTKVVLRRQTMTTDGGGGGGRSVRVSEEQARRRSRNASGRVDLAVGYHVLMLATTAIICSAATPHLAAKSDNCQLVSLHFPREFPLGSDLKGLGCCTRRRLPLFSTIITSLHHHIITSSHHHTDTQYYSTLSNTITH
jgi:hypothetical protein